MLNRFLPAITHFFEHRSCGSRTRALVLSNRTCQLLPCNVVGRSSFPVERPPLDSLKFGVFVYAPIRTRCHGHARVCVFRFTNCSADTREQSKSLPSHLQ